MCFKYSYKFRISFLILVINYQHDFSCTEVFNLCFKIIYSFTYGFSNFHYFLEMLSLIKLYEIKLPITHSSTFIYLFIHWHLILVRHRIYFGVRGKTGIWSSFSFFSNCLTGYLSNTYSINDLFTLLLISTNYMHPCLFNKE